MEIISNKHLFEQKDNIIEANRNPGNIDEVSENEGKELINKFFEEKYERKKKILNMKLKRIMEDFQLQESRIKEDIELEKAKKLSEFEDTLKMKALNKKLKLKSHEGLGSGEFLSLNESDDDELDVNDENRAKLLRK